LCLNKRDDLNKLKATAGERHERDAANNTDLKANADSRESAPQKTDSAFRHLTAAVVIDQTCIFLFDALFARTMLITSLRIQYLRHGATTRQRHDVRTISCTRCWASSSTIYRRQGPKKTKQSCCSRSLRRGSQQSTSGI
jgi:hypothetical protein